MMYGQRKIPYGRKRNDAGSQIKRNVRLPFLLLCLCLYMHINLNLSHYPYFMHRGS